MGRALAWVALAACLAGAPGVASAGGFYLLPRGARAIAQGGAQVAGSDDPGALWFNPAGLAYAQDQVLVDFVLPIAEVSYRRINAGGAWEPSVQSRNVPLPIPGFGLSRRLTRKVSVGGGLLAPTAALFNWPRTVRDAAGQTRAAPTRYSLVSMEGSGLAFLNLGVAYRPLPWLTLGASFVNLVGRFSIDLVMSVCDSALLCSQPEYEKYDADANIRIPFVWAPTGQLGAIVALDRVKLGLSWQLPLKLRGTATFTADLPTEEVAAFRGARLSNDQADFSADFPMIVRAGVELRAPGDLRVEASFGWEQWSVQDALDVRPRDISIEGAPGIGSYQVGPIRLERGMQDAYSVGLGARRPWGERLTLRAGYMWERSAFPDAYMTILTPDSDKHLLGVGISWLAADGLALDLSAGHVFFRPVQVRDSKVYQPYALRPPPQPDQDGQWRPGEAVPLGNGDYTLRASFIALGARVALN